MTDALPVPVEVDPDTGIWSVDAFPMILLPRHYWVAVMEAIEERIGVDAAAEVYFGATYKSAYVWCEQEALTHALAGIDVFHHYLRRMTERGWGEFTVESIDPANGSATVALTNSAVALGRPGAGHNVCHSFNGAFCGAMEYVAAVAGRPVRLVGRETECSANGARSCRFEVMPR